MIPLAKTQGFSHRDPTEAIVKNMPSVGPRHSEKRLVYSTMILLAKT